MITPWDNVDHFEKIVADYAGSKYGVAVDSCTNAIFLSLKYIQHTEKFPHLPVNVPKQTYPSVPMSVIHAGHSINFINLKWEGVYTLSPYPVIDSATRFKRDMYGGGLHCLSFHYKKHLPIGRGGMILTDDRDAAEWLKQARYDGRSEVSFSNIKDLKVCGWHMYMTPDQAATGIELFYRLKDDNPDLARWSDYKYDLSTFTCFKKIIDVPDNISYTI